MVGLVLQNPCIPARGVNHALISMLIQAGHPNRARPPYHRHQARDTETAFMEGNVRRCEQLYLRIDNYLEGDGTALALPQLFGREAFLVFGLYLLLQRSEAILQSAARPGPPLKHPAWCLACAQSNLGCLCCGSHPRIGNALSYAGQDCQLPHILRITSTKRPPLRSVAGLVLTCRRYGQYRPPLPMQFSLRVE